VCGSHADGRSSYLVAHGGAAAAARHLPARHVEEDIRLEQLQRVERLVRGGDYRRRVLQLVLVEMLQAQIMRLRSIELIPPQL